MRFPEEVVVQAFLPTYRALVAEALAKQGLAQDRIAPLVGVSQAQVSKYLAGRVELEASIAGDPRVRATVDEIAQGLTTGAMDPVDALATSLELVRRLQDRGPLCTLHEQAFPALAGTGCDACIQPTGLVMQEHQVLTTLRFALRRLAGVAGLARWVPHVGSNLAQARPGAETPWEVAAIPGRIDAVGDRVRIPAEPAFGASRHVAAVVLGVTDVHPQRRAAFNLAYRDELLDLVAGAGMRALAIDAAYDGRRRHVADRLREAVEGPPDVLYHEGAFGIEPVAYLLGHDAPHVVGAVERLLPG